MQGTFFIRDVARHAFIFQIKTELVMDLDPHVHSCPILDLDFRRKWF